MIAKGGKGILSETQQLELIKTLQTRFAANPKRHAGLEWEAIQNELLLNVPKLWSLYEMERTGGEPDIVGFDDKWRFIRLIVIIAKTN